MHKESVLQKILTVKMLAAISIISFLSSVVLLVSISVTQASIADCTDCEGMCTASGSGESWFNCPSSSGANCNSCGCEREDNADCLCGSLGCIDNGHYVIENNNNADCAAWSDKNQCREECSWSAYIPTDACTDSIRLIQVNLDDEGYVTADGTTIYSYYGCGCNCMDPVADGCASQGERATDVNVAFTRGSNMVGTIHAYNDCTHGGAGQYVAGRAYFVIKKAVCNSGYHCDASSGSPACVADARVCTSSDDCMAASDCNKRCGSGSKQWYSSYSCSTADCTCSLSSLTCDADHCSASCDENAQQTGGYSNNYCQKCSNDANCAWTNQNDGWKCDDTDHCSGNTYYDGYSCSTGACDGDYFDKGCCQGSKCDAGKYCEATTHACTNLPACKERNENGFGYTDASGVECTNDAGCASKDGWYCKDTDVRQKLTYSCNSTCQCSPSVSDQESCYAKNGWVGGGNSPATCGADPTSNYHSYSCGSDWVTGKEICKDFINETKNCDVSDNCTNTCDGDSIKTFKDYYVTTNTKTCNYQWGTLVQTCSGGSSSDNDGGDVPGLLGTCTSSGGCADGACQSGSFSDSCVSATQLTEYYNSGSSCNSKTYMCGELANNAVKYGSTCTVGNGATCNMGAFATPTGTGGGSESCLGACPGANCKFRLYSTIHSVGACTSVAESCTYSDNDPDLNSASCTGCLGAGKWNLGGAADATTCCGDEAGEVARVRECDAYCTANANDNACCSQASDCVWWDACYVNGSNFPGEIGSRCIGGVWRHMTAPWTTISPNGGDYTGTGTTSVTFALSCDAGNISCKNTYYKIINASNTCPISPATGMSTGTTDSVTCASGQICNKKVCYYSEDVVGNVEAMKTSNTFLFGPKVCGGKQCGEPCFGVDGICDGPDGACYSSGGCLLNCVAPAPGAGNERIWANSACGRTGSIKCGADSVCGNSYASCSVGGASTQVTGNWATYTYPSGTYGVGQTFQITLGGVTKSPSGFAILSECLVRRPDGTSIYFDNWGTDITYSYAFTPADPEGTWTVSDCGLYSDFIGSSGWILKDDSTQHTFILDKSPPLITINNPKSGDAYSGDFIVDATVTDSYSPIASVQYRWENASSTGTWASMALNGGRYIATCPVANLADGTYSIRVRANDSAGNLNDSAVIVVPNVRLDRQPPDIVILNPTSGWYSTDIQIKAAVSDVSGVNQVRYRWETTSSNGQWIPMTLAADGNYTATFAVASVASGNYTIRVWANDSAGNSDSRTVPIGIDRLPPSSSMTMPVAGTYIMNTVFNISWTGSDNPGGSGLNCYYVIYKYLNSRGQYSGEYNVRFPGGNCTSLAQYEFNPAIELPSISDVNNYTFFFKSLAVDNLGNLESKSGFETNITVYVPRLVNFIVFEKSTGSIIKNGGKVANNRTVVVNVKAKDTVPGNFDINVYYFSHALGVSPPDQLSNWDSIPCFATRECNASLTEGVGESDDIREVDYVIRAISSGSTELLPPTAPGAYFKYLIYRHPICNFVVNDIFKTTFGSNDLIAIEVRNFYDRYGMAGLSFNSGLARFLENGQQYIQIPLNPMEEKVIYARLIPPPPSEQGILLSMNGNTTADPLLTDQDTVAIVVGFPADFTELGDITAILLVAAACLIYLMFARKN